MPKSSKKVEFKKGDLVFAKLKGYPFWPAKVESVEVSEKSSNPKYKITFYGSYETNILKADALVAYNEESIQLYGGKKKLRNFNEAMWEIENDPDLKKRSAEDDEEDEEEGEIDPGSDHETDDRELDDLAAQTPSENPASDSDYKSKKSSASKKRTHVGNKKKKSDKKRDQARSKKRDSDDGDDEIPKTIKRRTKSSKKDLKSKKDKGNKEAGPKSSKKSTVKPEIKNESESSSLASTSSSPSSSSFTSADGNDQVKKEKVGDKQVHSPQKLPPSFEKQKSETNENLKSESKREIKRREKKEKKTVEKKMALVRSIRIQIALLRMDFEIKKSLKVDNTDVERCCLLMEDLIKLPFTQSHLLKAPEIVETIRKCRKFKSSERVCEKAKECFSKFLQILSISSSDVFLDVFEKERAKYLKTNEDKLKSERSLAYRLISREAKN